MLFTLNSLEDFLKQSLLKSDMAGLITLIHILNEITKILSKKIFTEVSS